MAAPAPRGESFGTGAPFTLFEYHSGNYLTRYASYAVTADGQRFLINEVVDMEPNSPLTVVTNWTAILKK